MGWFDQPLGIYSWQFAGTWPSYQLGSPTSTHQDLRENLFLQDENGQNFSYLAPPQKKLLTPQQGTQKRSQQGCTQQTSLGDGEFTIEEDRHIVGQVVRDLVEIQMRSSLMRHDLPSFRFYLNHQHVRLRKSQVEWIWLMLFWWRCVDVCYEWKTSICLSMKSARWNLWTVCFHLEMLMMKIPFWQNSCIRTLTAVRSLPQC